MGWPRRMAVVAAVLLMAAVVTGCTTPGAPNAARALQEIAPGVYLHRGVLAEWGPGHDDVANTAVVIGTRCVAVIDSGGSVAAGRRLLAGLRELTPLPVCYLINTHAHPDHVFGNAAFRALEPAPRIVGHARLGAALAARGPAYLNALRRDFGLDAANAARLIPPDVPVDGRLELDLGGRQLSLKAWPTAHTDADLSVLDEATRTLFLGDLLFVDHTPVVDGRLKGWLAALDELRGWPVTRVVPGHGAPSTDWPGALDAQQHYLRQLQADVRQALKDGLTLPQAVQRIAPDRPGWRLLDAFHARNVSAAYAELEWE